MNLLLIEKIFQIYQLFLIIIFFIQVFLFFFNNDFNFIFEKKTSDNITTNKSNKKTLKKIIDLSPDGEDDSDPEKLKKILKIILYISLFFFGGILLYYTYILFKPVDFTIENSLEQLKILLPEERYNQIYVVVLEMIERPDKLGKGIHLLHIIKTLLKDDFPKKFEKIMDDIISYFEGKK